MSKWGGGAADVDAFDFKNMPSHLPNKVPDGGNEVFIDGSARWVIFSTMYFLHSWSPYVRAAYFYQNPIDFPPALQMILPLLTPKARGDLYQ